MNAELMAASRHRSQQELRDLVAQVRPGLDDSHARNCRFAVSRDDAELSGVQ